MIKGYGQVHVDGVGPRQAHRVAYELKNGPIPEGLVVRHLVCDNPPCINPDHLAIGTVKDNNYDSIRQSRHAHGVRQGLAKLNDKLVVEARQRYSAGGVTMKQLALEYGVALSSMSSAIRGQTWKHLNERKDDGQN